MRKVMVLLVLAGMLISAGGCSTAISRVRFRGTTIYSGQSSNSVEERLGQPKAVSQCRYDWFWGYKWRPNSKAMQIDPWVSISYYEVIGGNLTEWVYSDNSNSLVLWLNSGIVGRIWLVPTYELTQ